MARRGASHSFNKRQKEMKRKEKAERKLQRRLEKRRPAEGSGTSLDIRPDNSAFERTAVEAPAEARAETRANDAAS